MKKTDSFNKFFLSLALLTTTTVLVPTTSVLASDYLLDSGVTYNSETFDSGTTIITLEGDHDALITDFQRIKFRNILDRRLIGTHMIRNVDTNMTEAFVIIAPKGSDCTSPEHSVDLIGNANRVNDYAQRYIWWETAGYEETGSVSNPKGEARYILQL